MSESCPFTDLVAAHALGALDEEERVGLERHLAAGCAECEPELAAMERVAEGIAASAPAVEPREEVRRGVIAKATAPVPTASVPTAPVPLRRPGAAAAGGGIRRSWAVAASIALLLLAGWGVLARKAWAEFAGIALAGINAFTQLMFIGVYPGWSVAAMAVDALIIYALTSRFDEFE